MVDFLTSLLSILLILTGVGLFICCAMALGLGDCTKKLWGLFISARPKSGIDKEIAEEEKEVAELERQKEKIDELAELKRRKERLFKEVHEDYEETSNEYWICPQCRITFKDLETLNNHSEIEHSF